MQQLTLEKANKIINAATQKARSLNMAPLTVVVLDASGHLKALQREDGATVIRQQIATAKAWGAVNMGISSRSLAAVAEHRPRAEPGSHRRRRGGPGRRCGVVQRWRSLTANWCWRR